MRATILTTILAGILVFTVSAEDRIVLAELFTGTWCTGCPYADSAIDSLAGEFGPENLVVLEYHYGNPPDTLSIPEGEERARWYSGEYPNLPNIWFDGVINAVGATSTSSAYAAYRGHIEDRMAVSSPLSTESQVSFGDTLGEVSTRVTVTQPFSEQALKLYFVLYENDVDGHNYVVRDMLPTEDLYITSPGDSVEVWRSFNIDSSWVREHMGMAVFVQSDTSRHVLQAERIDYSVTAIEENVSDARKLPHILQVAPNPFTRSVNIAFSLPGRLNTVARIYDSCGRLITTLLDGQIDCDSLSLEWRGRDIQGKEVPSGVYFLQLRSSDRILTKKIICIR